MAKLAKKKSIREFVNEEELKFQLNLMKYSYFLKDIETIPTKEIINLHNKRKQTKALKLKNDLKKEEFQIEIPKNALLYNLERTLNSEAFTTVESVMFEYQVSKKAYIKYLEEMHQETISKDSKKPEESKYLNKIKEVEEIILTSKVSKYRFGELLTLMVKNIAVMPSFKNYSNNWKDDFYSNAINRAFICPITYDDKLMSKRNGTQIKAFAYITQICFTAFVAIINERKKDEKFLKKVISIESSNLDGINTQLENSTTWETKERNTFTHLIEKDDLNEEINEIIDYVLESNEVHEDIESTDLEVIYLEKNTPNENKNCDYFIYLDDLIESKPERILDKEIHNIRFVIKDDVSLDLLVPLTSEDLCGLSLEIIRDRKIEAIEDDSIQDDMDLDW